MTPGETIDSQIEELETKLELLMDYLGLEFEFDTWCDEPKGIKEAKKGERMILDAKIGDIKKGKQ